MTIGYNWEWAKTVSRKQFISEMSAVYPDIDHGAAYDEAFPKKEKPAEPEAPQDGVEG